jgi:4-amino-4-deoxy-L-arabinose transferase-like glycosyltransferase
MAGPYVGPVKPYIVGIAFMIFGVSVSTLRATTASFGLLTVMLVYGMLRRRFGTFAAFCAAALLATDLNFVLPVRSDWSPLAFSLTASVAGAWLLLAWQRRPESLWIPSLAGLVFGLGLSHKFDFLVCIASLLVAFLCFFAITIKRNLKAVLLATACFVVGASPVIVFNVVTRGQTFREGSTIARSQGHRFPPSLEDLSTLGSDVVVMAKGLGRSLEGYQIADWMLGHKVVPASRLGRSQMDKAALVAPLLMLLVLFPGLRAWRRPAAFFLVALGVSLVLLAIVPFARGPHHVLLVYPLPHIIIGIALGALWELGRQRAGWRRIGLQVTAVVALVVLLAPNISLGRAFLTKTERDGGRGTWSAEALNSLVAALNGTYKGKRVVLMDWGFEQSLVVLGKDRFHLDAAYRRVMASPDPNRLLAQLVAQPDQVFVVHAPAFASVGAKAQSALDAYVASAQLHVTETKIFQKDGAHYCSILAFSAR